MWNPRLDDIGPVTGSAAGAVLCAVLAQWLGSRQSELCSETLGWIFLPVLFKHARRHEVDSISRPAPKPQASRSLLIVAAGVAIFSFCRAEIDVTAFIPALTPLLLKVQRRFGSHSRSSRTSNSWLFSPLVNTVWGTALAAAFVILALAVWNPLGLVLSTIPVAAIFVVYLAFMPKTVTSPGYLPRVNIDDAIDLLSSRVVAALLVALVLQTTVFGFTWGQLIPTLLSGLIKASSWYFVTRTAHYASWPVAGLIATFGIVATRDPFAQTSESQAVGHVVASFLTLGQTIHMLPKQARARSVLWIFGLVSLGPYLADVLAIRAQSSTAQSFRYSHEHPVEILIHNAKDDFAGLLEEQSTTYTAAYDEYERRYRTEPPPGFKGWYEFAKSHKSPIIDDFDMIHEAISPFLALSGKEITKIMKDAQDAPRSDLWLCSFTGKTATTQCRHPRRKFDRHIKQLFDGALEGLRGQLPDVKFLVNHIDEPRVLIPPPSEDEDALVNGKFNLTNMAHGPIWDTITKHCGSQSVRRAVDTRLTVDTYGLPFVKDRPSTMDLCKHSEYSSMHGILMSPTSFRLFEGLIPILSTGSLSTMGDILMPSPAYIEKGFQYEEKHDIDWDKKRNNLYWAGSNTGGYASDDQWPNYHRQRFVTMAQSLEPRQHHYLEESGGVVDRVASSFLNSRLFDVVFTRIFQCESKYCREQKAHFNVKAWADKDRGLHSRLVFDMDGNGISGRYYKLLASKSAPLKQTLFREWHDERLVPWVHYIPVSQSMEEVPELVVYLTSTEAGQARAREVAEQGRQWSSKALREVDMGIYMYRLLLELARLQDPKRPAS